MRDLLPRSNGTTAQACRQLSERQLHMFLTAKHGLLFWDQVVDFGTLACGPVGDTAQM